ncbi:MAG: methionine--tRNA ligase, partial [Desulfovibrionaceae bacterium]|nr:methionine--tRNA ligase [Desulfovibrionaceae bacterium]
TLFKNKNTARLSTVMYVLLENMRKIAVHLWPVMPASAERMLAQLGMTFDKEKVYLPKELDAWGILDSGSQVAESSNLFPRVELPEPAPTPKPEGAPKPAPKAEPLAEAEFEDFQKLDIRVGTVLEALRHPDADKLLVVRVDLGEAEPRQIVSGIAEFFKPEELPGRQVVVVANLKPRKIRKQLSQGMILTVKTEAGMELLATPGQVPGGSRVS